MLALLDHAIDLARVSSMYVLLIYAANLDMILATICKTLVVCTLSS